MKTLLAACLALNLSLTLAAPLAAQDHMTMPAVVELGALKLSQGFSRATLPNAPVAGGFLTIENTGAEDDRLIGAASPIAGHMEVHEMAMDGEVMKMRELKDGLVIPAGAIVELKPGGFHIMFMDLQAPLVEGETVPVTLTFEKAGSIEVPLLVGASNADEMQHAGHGEHGHMKDHSAPAAFDQSAIAGDLPRIDGLLRATFETADNPLTLDPILIDGDVAIVGWVQSEMGGRALLGRDAHGIWAVHLCAGAGLKGADGMVALGIPSDIAQRLGDQQAKAEAALPPETVQKLDSFGEPVRFD